MKHVEMSSVSSVLNAEITAAVEVLKQGGHEISRNISQVLAYAQRAQVELAEAAADPDFVEIAEAKRDAIVMYAAVRAIEGADEVDERARLLFVQTIGSVLRIGAGILASV